jgi:hypothetical protein
MPGWDDVPILERHADDADESLIELGESGWDHLVGWVVGVPRMRRVVDRRTHMTTVEYPGIGVRFQRPRSPSEQADIEKDINGYLAEAGVPPRPAGYIWYVLKPPTVASEDEFWARVNQAQYVSVRPEHLISVLPAIVDELYPPGWPGVPDA